MWNRAGSRIWQRGLDNRRGRRHRWHRRRRRHRRHCDTFPITANAQHGLGLVIVLRVKLLVTVCQVRFQSNSLDDRHANWTFPAVVHVHSETLKRFGQVTQRTQARIRHGKQDWRRHRSETKRGRGTRTRSIQIQVLP